MNSFPLWYLPLLLYFICSTSYSLSLRKMAKNSKVPLGLIPMLIVTLVCYPLALIISLASGQLSFNFSTTAIVFLILQAVLTGIYNVIPFRINKYIDATQYVVIGNIYTPVTVALGVVLLRESFSTQQYVGSALLILGAILVAIKDLKAKTWRLDRHSWELIIMSIFFGAGLVAEKGALNYMSVYTYIVVGWGMQFFVTILASYRDWGAISKIEKNDWLEIFKVGLIRSGHIFGYIFALSLSNNVAFMASIVTFRIPLVFIASYFLLKERDNIPRKIVGVVVATVGLLLL